MVKIGHFPKCLAFSSVKLKLGDRCKKRFHIHIIVLNLYGKNGFRKQPKWQRNEIFIIVVVVVILFWLLNMASFSKTKDGQKKSLYSRNGKSFWTRV